MVVDVAQNPCGKLISGSVGNEGRFRSVDVSSMGNRCAQAVDRYDAYKGFAGSDKCVQGAEEAHRASPGGEARYIDPEGVDSMDTSRWLVYMGAVEIDRASLQSTTRWVAGMRVVGRDSTCRCRIVVRIPTRWARTHLPGYREAMDEMIP